jgi:hypothetical protein
MYLLNLNASKVVISCYFTEEDAELTETQVQVSWADYLTVLVSPTTPFCFIEELLPIPSPSIYHTWVNFEWVLDENKLMKARNERWLEIQAVRDHRLDKGGFKIGNYWYHSDQPSQSNYTDLLMMGSNVPAGLMWKTMSKAYVEMTSPIVGQLLFRKVTQKNLTFQAAALHEIAMKQSADPLNYDFTTGWPPIYGE